MNPYNYNFMGVTGNDKIQHKGWGGVANTDRGEAECYICHKTPTPVQHE